MNNRIYLNNGWRFSEQYCLEMVALEFDDSGMEEVRLPHTFVETPFHYFDEQIYQMEGGYRRRLLVPREWEHKSIFLTMEGSAHETEVFLNGKKIGEHHCGYTAFSIDISRDLQYHAENILTVKVDSREDRNIPPFGYVVDYMTYGGIYRDVYLEVKNRRHIEDVFLRSEPKIGELINTRLVSEVSISTLGSQVSLRQWMRRKGKEEFQLLGESEVENQYVELDFAAGEICLWELDKPVLYEIKTELLYRGEVQDENITVTGFRKAEFLKDGFYLNGKKIKIRGLNRHQSYPYVGYAMPKSMQEMDADILKRELGLNAVRTAHYPQSHYFLNRCDEIGLLVFTELPGWQHIGDETWKRQAVRNVQDMVKQYRNHTSIILWGVRINESKDDDAFYMETNEAARALDPSRTTAGVRAHKRSSLLEDVYTYNDFSHDGKAVGCEPKKAVTPDLGKAYLISEYNGHMFPTKIFDGEEHRTEHAIRHANVLDAVAGQEDIAGSFGWCFADYNTHKDFGSGDRICYHGVLDMFRNPKLAAAVYASQQEDKDVLELSSTMDIGEHPGCNRRDTWIFTNADSVRMYKNDRLVKEYQREESPYPHLEHGPILIDDFIGEAIVQNEKFKPAQAQGVKKILNMTARYGLADLPKSVYVTAFKLMLLYGMKPAEAVVLYNRYVGDWGGAATQYRFEAIRQGQVVKSLTKVPMKKVRLVVEASHRSLQEGNTYDVAAVRIRAVDERGNLLPFYQEPVWLETTGPLEVLGGDVISLKGGMGGTYLKTTGQSGEATLSIKTRQAEEISIVFAISIKDEQ